MSITKLTIKIYKIFKTHQPVPFPTLLSVVFMSNKKIKSNVRILFYLFLYINKISIFLLIERDAGNKRSFCSGIKPRKCCFYQ